MVLPKMKWAMAIYDIPLSTVYRWEQTTNKFLRSWLGAGHTLSRRCLFSRDSGVALPIDSLLDTWKVEKCRLQQSYNTSTDPFVTSNDLMSLRLDRVGFGLLTKLLIMPKGILSVKLCEA